MTRLRLSDEDRERMGLEQEWIEGFSLAKFMVGDAESLEEAGYSPDEFVEEVRGIPVYRDGEPVMEDDGKRQRRRTPMRAIRAAMWLAVRRAGLKIPFADFDFQLNNVTYEDDEPAGKAPAATRASSRTARATGSRSSKRSASSRGRSSA